MSNLFRSVPIKKPKRNLFNLSHEVRTTCNMGKLVPILCEPVLPGDKWKLQTEILVRLAPMLSPVMARVNVYTHFFFVPYRLIWKDWKTFITRGPQGLSAPQYPLYRFMTEYIENNPGLFSEGSLLDHLGFPVPDLNNLLTDGVTASHYFDADALPIRAYQRVYDDYYRDENFTSSMYDPEDGSDVNPFFNGSGLYTISSSNAVDLGNPLHLRNRAWEKDYFTSALPWAQRGGIVDIPIGDIPEQEIVLADNENAVQWRKINDMPASPNGTPVETVGAGSLGIGGNPIQINPNGSLKTEGITLNSVSINDLRRAFRLQEWLEKNARGGYRYIEQILSHFGVRSSDARLQRSEYLGGGRSPIIISEVLQQSQSTDSSAQGTMTGHGISAQVTHQFKRRFEEHGVIIGIMSIMPKASYQQGMRRHFLKRSWEDFYWPEFANLGEQPIQNQELFYSFTGGQNNPNSATFGYTPRYAEYKFIPSSVHGDFRTNLDFWHMGRIFTSTPTLSREFVAEDPTTRIFAVDDKNKITDHCWVQIYHNIYAVRPMPKFGVPKF